VLLKSARYLKAIKMTDRFPEILAQTVSAERAEFEFYIPENLFWFLGHFPDAPILPGIVQIHWALHYARTAGLNTPEALQDFQVKYRNMILPGMRICLVASSSPEKGLFTFEFTDGGQVCSSGSARLMPRGVRHG
jgi:3-hydroxymyristoyl/3-hydroxydecanoyl-(acyl carrier protein) dehydratase